MLQYLILGITFAFAAAVQPGPLQAYLINKALTNGWRRTIAASFSPIISDGPIIVIVLLILVNMPQALIHILQIIGGLFLLYLAIGAFKTYRNFNTTFRKDDIQPNKETLLKAALVNFFNPNPYLGWSLVMGPLLIKGWKESPINGITLLLSFYLTIVLSLALTIIIFAKAGNLGKRVSHILIGISSAALGCFGIYQLWSGIKIFFS